MAGITKPLRIIDLSEKPNINEYASAWKAFDTAWDRMCSYHRDQAISISKAKSEGLFDTGEAMSELGRLRTEREKCKECKV